MSTYEQRVKFKTAEWRRKIVSHSGLLQRVSKKAQTKVNSLIPERVHYIMTESIKKVVQAALIGSEFTSRKRNVSYITLEEKEQQVLDTLNTYKKTAAIEGAGTGAGGIFLGLADFPLLLSIKMKFLFETAGIYGYDVKEYEERLFILQVFQLAFSSDEHRQRTLDIIEHWEERKYELKELDWRTFQQEYRDYIDFVKMLQLLPGIGAVVGAYANYNLLEHLGEVAMNAYRLRLFKSIEA
ncbi:EcsC family protein [Aneurinibacillus migulanus]|uniref:EcsC family protein n=1 Tax=Aneurinibacillus migulanus TaxID=47500 RepID=UPI00209FF882|nr:EcsC family protein [Aneurinibacillus migulanus]MCP1356454.1 EcsC family protein [Aneurinibacillus migulanus]